MIIEYNRDPKASIDEKLTSLAESVMRALGNPESSTNSLCDLTETQRRELWAIINDTGLEEYEASQGYYMGPYEITPQAQSDVSLEVAELIMKEDVTVNTLPYAEFENEAGGTTIQIGEDL